MPVYRKIEMSTEINEKGLCTFQAANITTHQSPMNHHLGAEWSYNNISCSMQRQSGYAELCTEVICLREKKEQSSCILYRKNAAFEYNAIFLVINQNNRICLWRFTGQWNLQWQQVFLFTKDDKINHTRCLWLSLDASTFVRIWLPATSHLSLLTGYRSCHKAQCKPAQNTSNLIWNTNWFIKRRDIFIHHARLAFAPHKSAQTFHHAKRKVLLLFLSVSDRVIKWSKWSLHIISCNSALQGPQLGT